MSHGIAGVLLAAGAGSRFGGDKLLHRLPNGVPIAVAAAVNLRPACERMVAVLRFGDEELATLLAAAGCEIMLCAEADLGMGHSLAAGVRATADASAWLVALADMPFIAGTTHHAVAASLRAGASLAASQYQGRRGHPVGFAKKWFAQLSEMTGDQGGKIILNKHREDLILCPVDDPGATRDIDYQEDLINIAGFGGKT
jgi:molybdenum cofactor cytidylyltransferase